MEFRLSDYYTSFGKVVDAKAEYQAIFEFEGGAAANFTRKILEKRGTKRTEKVKKAI